MAVCRYMVTCPKWPECRHGGFTAGDRLLPGSHRASPGVFPSVHGVSGHTETGCIPHHGHGVLGTASVALIPQEAAKEAKEISKEAELKDRPIEADPRPFTGVAIKNRPDCWNFGRAKMKRKANVKIYCHREYQLQGERAEAMNVRMYADLSGPLQKILQASELDAIVCAPRNRPGNIRLQRVMVCTNHQSLQRWHKEHVGTPSGPVARRARWHETFAVCIESGAGLD